MAETKAHIYVTIVAALIMAAFCLVVGYSPVRTAVVVIATIAVTYVLGKAAVVALSLTLFKKKAEPAEAEPTEAEDGDADDETDSEE